MAANKFLKLVLAGFEEVFGLQVSAGLSDAGKILAADDTGKLHPSLLPVGVGADVKSLPATEALVAGNFVNIYSASGTPSVRKADGSAAGKPCDGFVLAAVASGATALVYKEGTNDQCTGLTPGVDMFLSTTPGLATNACPTAAGNVQQRIGKSLSATEVDFERGYPMTVL